MPPDPRAALARRAEVPRRAPPESITTSPRPHHTYRPGTSLALGSVLVPSVSLIHPPTCQPYLSCDHIFSSGETDRRSRVIIMKQRFSRTHRRPVARGKVNELGRASTQARRASVPPPPSSALDQRFHRAISARFPRDHADASRRAYADASWRGHVPGSTDVPSVPARRE